MSDFGAPVAGNVDVNPLRTLGDILGLKQKQQALQGQAADVQTKQIGAQNAAVTQREQQAIGAINPEDFTKDGVLDAPSYARAAVKAAPFSGLGFDRAAKAYEVQHSQIQVQKSAQDLNEEQRRDASSALAAVAADPKSTYGDIVAAGDQHKKLNPAASRVMDTLMQQLHPNDPIELTKRKVVGLSRAMLGADQLSGAGGLNTGSPAVINDGGYQRPGMQSNVTGAFTPSGTAVKNTISPGVVDLGNGQKAILQSDGQYQVVRGGGGAGAAKPSAPADTGKLAKMVRPDANAPAADQANYNSRIKSLGDEYSAVSTAANNPVNGVQATRFRNQQIHDLIPHATTGPGLKLLNTLASRVPGATPEADAYQNLEHYLSQNSAAMAQTMGVPHTNLGAETAAAAAGNVERNPGALNEITKTNDALNTALDLYNRGFAKVTNNGSDMSKAASYKQAFGQTLDINAIRWADAHRRKDQEEIADLGKKLGKDGIKEVQSKLRVLKSLSESGDLP